MYSEILFKTVQQHRGHFVIQIESGNRAMVIGYEKLGLYVERERKAELDRVRSSLVIRIF